MGEAASYQQYQELKACTFKPEINREVPKPQVRAQPWSLQVLCCPGYGAQQPVSGCSHQCL